ncbi:hypothetical protein S2E19_03403 [Bacillus mycoides]|nr:hypothetical protein BTJ44_02529 [Bacillus mycoides]OSY08870.1 hypothetical protein S2E19_03403 [Bacillus mycoides]
MTFALLSVSSKAARVRRLQRIYSDSDMPARKENILLK